MWRLTRHWVVCSLSPGVGGIFFLSLSHFLFHFIVATVGYNVQVSSSSLLG